MQICQLNTKVHLFKLEMQKQLLNIIRKGQVVFLFKTFLLEHSQKCISLMVITIHSKSEKAPSCASHTTNETDLQLSSS